MEIIEPKKEDEQLWDEYVFRAEQTTFYHQLGWGNVVGCFSFIHCYYYKMIAKVFYKHWDNHKKDMFTHNELLSSFKKGFRNGNWRKFTRVEKAFYRASLIYSRIQGKIVNSNLLEQLSALVDKLLETPGVKVLKRGLERAKEMMQKYGEEGVFEWAPSLRRWLNDKNYIVWLGTFSPWG